MKKEEEEKQEKSRKTKHAEQLNKLAGKLYKTKRNLKKKEKFSQTKQNKT